MEKWAHIFCNPTETTGKENMSNRSLKVRMQRREWHLTPWSQQIWQQTRRAGSYTHLRGQDLCLLGCTGRRRKNTCLERVLSLRNEPPKDLHFQRRMVLFQCLLTWQVKTSFSIFFSEYTCDIKHFSNLWVNCISSVDYLLIAFVVVLLLGRLLLIIFKGSSYAQVYQYPVSYVQ